MEKKNSDKNEWWKETEEEEEKFPSRIARFFFCTHRRTGKKTEKRWRKSERDREKKVHTPTIYTYVFCIQRV